MVRRKEELPMTKLTTIVSGALLLGAAVSAQAADKAPAPAAAAAPAAAPAAAKAPASAPATAGAVAAAAAAGPPVPSPEIDALFKGYEGSYKCDTTFPAGSMGPGSPEMKMKTDVKIKKEAGGFWYKGEFKIKKSKAMPGIEGTFMMGYDAAAKAPMLVLTDSMGTFAVEHASGATADKIVYVGEGTMMGMKSKVRETMEKKDAKTIEHTLEVDMGKGFQPMGTDVCKK
jgi:hypothetical protein